jgi:succinate dehydrogenase / fumarate reductase iron-sulfur subunit
MKLKVFRSGRDESRRYDTFEVPDRQGMTVLDALFYVRDHLDDSLVFRYSCRGAVCGSCAMLINKIPRLACRTQLAQLLRGPEALKIAPYEAVSGGERWEPGIEVLVEPLPHMPVIRDLVVDQDSFFAKYRKMRPVFRPKDPAPHRERPMIPEQVRELERYTNCILCAACYGACPVNGRDPGYIGPAALAKLYRFHIDPREGGDGSRLLLEDAKTGWWDCHFYSNCTRVCPKGVPPSIAIAEARKGLKGMGRENPWKERKE